MFLVDYKKHMREGAMTASNHEVCFANNKLQRSFVIKYTVVFAKLKSDCYSDTQAVFSDFLKGNSCLERK